VQIVFETAGTQPVIVTVYEPGGYELMLQRIGDLPKPPVSAVLLGMGEEASKAKKAKKAK